MDPSVNDDDTTLLAALEHRAPPCPHGHGRLTPSPDTTADTGMNLTCHTCGTRRPLDLALLRGLLDTNEPTPDPACREDATTVLTVVTAAEPPDATERTTILAPVHDTPTEPTDVPESQPATARGLRPDGTIRTTGWLQIGTVVVSSGVWAALLGLTAACLLFPHQPLLSSIVAVCGWTLWKVTTVWIRPASTAINRDTVAAADLTPGACLRIYGPIGPVGVLHGISSGRRGRVRLHFGRDTYRYVPADTPCHRVEIRI